MNTITKNGVETNMKGYRLLVPDVDVVAVGDEWFNSDWEVSGHFIVMAGDKHIGSLYTKDFKPMIRRLSLKVGHAMETALMDHSKGLPDFMEICPLTRGEIEGG